jgi:hypothetical protein
MNIELQNKVVLVETATTIKMQEHFTLITTDKTYDLLVDISANFKDIPEQYHEVFLNMLTSKYLNKVSFGDNPFSLCKPPAKNKWWQFWKWSIWGKI